MHSIASSAIVVWYSSQQEPKERGTAERAAAPTRCGCVAGWSCATSESGHCVGAGERKSGQARAQECSGNSGRRCTSSAAGRTRCSGRALRQGERGGARWQEAAGEHCNPNEGEDPQTRGKLSYSVNTGCVPNVNRHATSIHQSIESSLRESGLPNPAISEPSRKLPRLVPKAHSLVRAPR